MKNFKIFILFLSIYLIVIFSGCDFIDKYIKKNKNKEQDGLEVIKVRTTEVKESSRNINNTLIGTAEPEFDVNIRSQIEGKVKKIYVSVGDIVEGGDVLATFEDQEIRLRVKQAGINVKDAKSEVERAKLEKQEKLLEMEREYTDVEADYLRKKILLDKSREKSESTAKLYRIKAATLEEVKEAERNFEKAKIDYAASAKKYETSKELFGEEKNIREKMLDLMIEKKENQLLNIRSELEKAQLELDKYTVKSPDSGMISDVFKTNNQYVSLSEPDMFSLIGVKDIHVMTNVSESDIRKIHKGNEVDVKFDAIQGSEYIGEIISIKPVIDTASRSFPVRILIPNPDNIIKPGMYARISFAKLNQVKAIWIPSTCIRKSGSTTFVYKVKNNLAIKTAVETGRQSDELVEVTSGLSTGDVIITEGVDKVSDLSKVSIIG